MSWIKQNPGGIYFMFIFQNILEKLPKNNHSEKFKNKSNAVMFPDFCFIPLFVRESALQRTLFVLSLLKFSVNGSSH